MEFSHLTEEISCHKFMTKNAIREKKVKNYCCDCSREAERHLLLGRKAVTNLHGVLKSRDTTLSTKAQLVKAMVFPVVMHGCEIWTIEKAER